MNSIDNPMIRLLGRVADLIILNLLWICCSIPVVTIGASTAALYTVMLKIVKNEEGYIAKGFFKAFRVNFRQATKLWLPLLLFGMLLVMDYFAARAMPPEIRAVMQVLLPVLGAVLISVCTYAFALQARFENTVRNTLKNALILTFAKLPFTVMILILTIGPAVMTFLTMKTIVIGGTIWLTIGVSLLAWLISLLLRNVFDQLSQG